MSLHLVVGCSGAGKTQHMYKHMIEQFKPSMTDYSFMIVPEQFTLQTQQDLVALHPNKGIMHLEVLSFQRLAYRLYDDMGLAGRKLLNDTGKSMAIRRIIETSKERYSLFGKQVHKKGYIRELKALLTEVSQYNLKTDVLEKMAATAADPMLSLKIKDLSTLAQAYENYVEEGYFTSDTTMSLLAEAVRKSSLISRAEILIDGFYGFTPVQYEIIRHLLRHSKDLHISITADSSVLDGSCLQESELYHPSQKMYERLIRIAKEEGIAVRTVDLEEARPRYQSAEALKHLERQIFRFPAKPYGHKPSGITLSEAPTMRRECRYVADSIMKLVMENGYRYKEIAVLTGDLPGYGNILKQTFSSFDIPFFIDQKKSVKSHPFVALILSFLDILNRDFAYEPMFRYLRSGLLDIEDETLDLLENYVLAYGIRGSKLWSQPWTRDYPYLEAAREDDYHRSILERINRLRTEIWEPFRAFKESLGKTETVRKLTEMLYRWSEERRLQEKCRQWAEHFEQQGQLNYQKSYQQIFKKIVEVMEQAVEILGEQKMSLSAYQDLLDTGFEACEMALVPPGLDQIVVGDLERSRIKEVKALFVIGFNEGKVPKASNQASLITDHERRRVLDLGFEIAPDSRTNLFAAQMNVYAGLMRVRERLYISYAKSDNEGKAMRPAILFKQIRKLFPKLTVLDLEEIYLNRLVVNRPEPTFEQLISRMMHTPLQETDDQMFGAYRWFYQNNLWKNGLLKTEAALSYDNNEAPLSDDLSRKLYSDTLVNSVSRLEAFARCPFAHFMDYGLKVKERLDYSIKMPDIGILFHKAIDLCSKEMSMRNIEWDDFDAAARDELVERTVEAVVSEEPRGIFKNSSRNNYLVKRLTRITKRAMQAISYQITKGDFRPIAFEQGFNGDEEGVKTLNIDFGDKRSMKLTGRMDRLDGYRDEENLYLTVVDYKSGSRNFDLLALYYGLQLQLFVYLNAAIEVNALAEESRGLRVKPAGVFYFHIDDPILQEVEGRSREQLEAQILKALKLKGLVLNDRDIIKHLDKAFEKTSDVIPVALNAQGNPTKTASVVSETDFERLRQYAQHQVIDTGKRIIQGQIQARPYKKKQETACDYCGYSSVCRFEKGISGNSYRFLELMSKEEIFEKIDTKGAEVFGGSH